MTIEPFIAIPAGVVPNPRRLVGLADTVVRVRGEVALAEQRRTTMTTLAATLAVQGTPAKVTAKEPNGVEWSITIGHEEPSQP